MGRGRFLVNNNSKQSHSKKKVSSFFCFFSFFHLRLGQTTTTTAPAEASNRAHASFYHPLHQNFEKKEQSPDKTLEILVEKPNTV